MWFAELGDWQDYPAEDGERWSQKKVPGLQVKAVERRWWRLNSNLNESYKSDEAATLNKQIEDLSIADSKGEYTTTWNIVPMLSGKCKKICVKVNKRDSTPPKSETDLPAQQQQ